MPLRGTRNTRIIHAGIIGTVEGYKMLQGHAIGVAVPVVIFNPELPKKAAEEPSS